VSLDDGTAWKSKLRDAIVAAKLTPIRAQLYGRGTYAVITVAGWYAPIKDQGPTDPIAPVAESLCAANGNLPLGLFAAFNRRDILRIHCKGTGPTPNDHAYATWESFK
jgi:hypothetical protein